MTDGGRATVLTRTDSWLANRWIGVVVVILGLAILLRVMCFAELRDSPAFATHLHSEMDTKFFADVAHEIRRDGWLRESPLHPDHYWHRLVAEEHYKAHPEEVPDIAKGRAFATLPDPVKRECDRQLWDRWYGGYRFHQEPLFSYLTAVFFSDARGEFGRVKGPVPAMYVFQMMIGVVTIGLMLGLVRRTFSHLVATLTGLMLVFWGPMIHYEMVLLRTTLIISCGVLLLHVCQRFGGNRERMAARPWWHYLLLGVLFGAVASLKTTFLLFGGGLLIGMLWNSRHDRVVLARGIGCVAGGVLIALLPWVYRNATVGVSWFSLTSVGAVTFAGTNLPQFDPWKGWYPFEYPGALAEVMHASDGGFLAVVGESIARHDSISDYVGLLWLKFASICHAFELPNNSNFYFNSLYSDCLSLTHYLVTFGWVLPFALLGLVLSCRRPGVRMWWWFFACTVAPMVVFYSLSRFRAPLAVGLMPFAAVGIVGLVEYGLRRRWGAVVLALLGVVVMLFVMHREIPPTRVIGKDYQNAWTLYYSGRMEQAIRRNDALAGAALYERFLSTFPQYVLDFGTNSELRDPNEAAFAVVALEACQRASILNRATGDMERATRYAEIAARLDKTIGAYAAAHGITPKR